jgi:hypothetical protein
MHKELFALAKFFGDSCSNCKERCCTNMMLQTSRDATKQVAKHLNMKPLEFRLKYTIMTSNYLKEMEKKYGTGNVVGTTKYGV